jgi:hypothetical protein
MVFSTSHRTCAYDSQAPTARSRTVVDLSKSVPSNDLSVFLCCLVRNIGVKLLVAGLGHLEHVMHATNYGTVLLQVAAVKSPLFSHTK